MSEALRSATHARHYAEPAQKTDADGTSHWITRAANFVTVISDAPAGAVLARNNPDVDGLILESTFTSIREMARQYAWGWLPVDLVLTQRFVILELTAQNGRSQCIGNHIGGRFAAHR